MSLWKTPKREFFVRSKEQTSCPCCNGRLKVVGSRKRICLRANGDRTVLVVRRLKCADCDRCHNELPDILIPYKRYDRESIESVVSNESDLPVCADESTLYRWRTWFKQMADHFQGCLASIMIRYGKESAEDRSGLSESKLQRIWQYVGDAPGWLARGVQPIANSNLWRHTRSAFCP